jgi:xanthine dehydrogenase accessory factor
MTQNLLLELGELKKQHPAFVLCLITHAEGSTPRKAGASMVVFPDGLTSGTIGGGNIEMKALADALLVLKSGCPASKSYQLEDDLEMRCGGRVDIYFEPFLPDNRLIIYGAGHVGNEVGRYASDLGFRICFVDHRAEILDSIGYPAEKILCSYNEAMTLLSPGENDFVVVTTPKHEFDEEIIEQLAPLRLAYLGMIGSKRKVAETRNNILKREKITPGQLDRVDMPIGIPFRAETPREIAFSIVARLIDVKNTRHGK